jgi:hypothetical protein
MSHDLSTGKCLFFLVEAEGRLSGSSETATPFATTAAHSPPWFHYMTPFSYNRSPLGATTRYPMAAGHRACAVSHKP